jgi:uncharacterized membrane protein
MTFTDEKMERIVANLLRGGVLLSAAVILAGGIGYLAQHGQDVAEYRTFHGETADFRSAEGVLRSLAHWDWRAVIQIGLLLLIATPVVRVGFSIAGFALERDRTYVMVTVVVLAILLVGLFGKP